MLQIEEKKSVVDKNLQVTERAARQITNLMERDEREGCFLRIRVLGGGCSGMQYNLSFENDQKEDDLSWDSQGVRVITDPASFEYVAGSTVDFEDGLNGSGFKIGNPNAATTCGCGDSFGI